MSRCLTRILFGLPVFLLLISAARAQITGVSTPVPGGHDYIKMLNETVNPANGSVSLHVDVPVPPGRRLTLPFSFNYNSSAVFTPQGDGISGQGYLSSNPTYMNKDGWFYGLPRASAMFMSYTQTGYPPCYFSTGYAFSDSAGTTYSFNSLIAYLAGPRTCVGHNSVLGQNSGFYAAAITSSGTPLTITAQDNTTYSFPGVGSGNGCGIDDIDPGFSLPSSIEDRNGNIITITSPDCTGSFTATDTLGRTAISSSGFGTTGNTITVPGVSAPYTVTWSNASMSGFHPGYTWDNPSDQWCDGIFAGPGNAPMAEITAITLPNGKQYTFTYDSTYGLLSKVTYPNGGYISYTWTLNTRSDFAAVSDANGAAQNCQYTYDAPALLHRYVSYDGSTIAEQQDFSYTTTWNPSNFSQWTAKTTNVTTHDLVNGTSFQTNYTYSPVTVLNGGNQWLPSLFGTQAAVEQTIVYKGTSGSTLRTVNKTWWDQYDLKTEQTVLETGQTSQVNLNWSGLLVTEKDEYDFGLTLARKTTYTYCLTSPTQTIVYDGNGNRLAETDSVCDGASTAAVSNLPTGTHDETNYGPGSTNVRGNITQTTKQCFQGTTACANNIVTSYTYDETGQMLTSTDPNGHVTHYSYADSYTTLSGGVNVTYTPSANTNAFLTMVTNPLSQTQNYTYDFNNGHLTASKDANSLVTSYVYNDSLARPTLTTRPDGGTTTVTYNDTAHTVTSAKKINSTQTITSVAVSDGVGHVKQTQLTSDPQGTVYTDTTYDGLGHVRTASNPYRTGPDPTTSAGTSTYFYDAIGRKCLEVPPDGTLPSGNVCSSTQPANTIFTTYSGNTTTVTDQTGKSRKSVVDGLGRLTQIFEDPGTSPHLNYETDYGYDALGNLLCVGQKGTSTGTFTNCTSIPSGWHPRTFSYDSLSRLLTSTNPEVGTITYKYDSDANCSGSSSFLGLLVSKTDARGIRTCAQYDAVNRETVLNYSNGDPSITTIYDQTNCLTLSTCQNIGSRTSVTDAAGTESWAYQVDATNHRSVHANQRTTNSVTKTSTYYLDMAGNLTQVVYPTGRTVNYTYNAANRPITSADGSNGITYATDFQSAPTGCLAGAVCYTPQGTFYALSIGQVSSGFTGLNLTHTYNNRLQPNEFKASSSGGNAIDITYSFIDSVTGHNAGHVNGITNNLDATRSQTFTYDSLNRITGALTTSTHATSPAHCWGEAYTLDAWGNLNSIAASTNSNYTGCTQESGFSSNADGNNRLPTWAYDASGNATSDGVVTNYQWNAESELKSAAGVNYAYGGDGRRVSKSGGASKLYWYGSGGDILAETDSCGNPTAEYIFFGGKRVAMIPWTGANCSTTVAGNPTYHIEDLLGTSRVVTTNTGVVCYDADFYPFGGERTPYTNNCPATNNYKFEGKERDAETGNDDFGARYYSNRFGRWLSADWSNDPEPVPYANLTNPQTLNLYAMVADDPESFSDLDGHTFTFTYQVANPAASGAWDPTDAEAMSDMSGLTQEELTSMMTLEAAQAVPAKQDAKNNSTTHQEKTDTQENKKEAAVSTSGGQGGGRKGERRHTRRPSKPGKHAKPVPGMPGRWWVVDPQTGKKILKPPGWSPETASQTQQAAETSTASSRAADTALKMTVIAILTKIILELATGSPGPPEPAAP
jgi:RHS repeat-associated protein